jgi:MraZ protein
MGFSGEFINSIDAKGRIVIPAKLREQLSDGFVITRGLSHCAFILPKATFESMEEELSKASFTDKNARAMQVFFIGSKIDGEIDGQGRVGLTQSIRKFARLQKEVVITGVGKRIEIWDKQTYEDYLDSFTDSEEFLDGIQGFDL